LFRKHDEARKAVMGWLAFNDGGNVKGVRPDGYGNKGEGDGWNEELWCFDRVEQAIGVYGGCFKGNSNIAKQELRRLLKAVYWESTEPKEYPCLVELGLGVFLRHLERECQANPRLRVYEGA
jgi:hypothetical protein